MSVVSRHGPSVPAPAFTPTKGGDGGAFVPRRMPAHWEDNGRVVLTGDAIGGADRAGFEAGLVETRDPCDRAHLWREQLAGVPRELPESMVLADHDMLRSRFHGRALPGEPRRYHASQVTSRGMPYDSMFDDAALTAARLQADLGIDLGWRTGFPRAQKRVYAGCEIERARALAGMEGKQARRMLERKVRVSMTTREFQLEQEANALLRRRAR